jgi:hypothetical protein
MTLHAQDILRVLRHPAAMDIRYVHRVAAIGSLQFVLRSKKIFKITIHGESN